MARDAHPSPAAGTRIVFSSTLRDAAHVCCAAATEQALAIGVDVHIIEPDTTWAVGDIEALLQPVRFAGVGAVCVAVGLDRANPAVWDRLLRTLEEPHTPWWLWVAVSDPAALPHSLRGRALSELPAPPRSAVRYLTDTGWGEQSSDLAAVLGDNVACVGAQAPADTEAAVSAYRHLAAVAASDASPGELATACDQIAKLFSEPVRGREALRWVAETKMNTLRSRLRTSTLTGDRAAFTDALGQLDRARHTLSLLDRHTSVATAAWALSVGGGYEP
jgi:hypothetical protein